MRAIVLTLSTIVGLVLAGCNPADDGPTVCDHFANPVLAQDPSGAPIPVPDGGIIDKATCASACDGSTCGSAPAEGGVFITCIDDAGVNCHR